MPSSMVVTFPWLCPACQEKMDDHVGFKQHCRNKTRNRKSNSFSTKRHLALFEMFGEEFCLGEPRKSRKSATAETVIPSPVKPLAIPENGVLFTIGSAPVPPQCLLVIDITSRENMRFPGFCPAQDCRAIIESLGQFKTHQYNAVKKNASVKTRVNHRILHAKLPPDIPAPGAKTRNAYVRETDLIAVNERYGDAAVKDVTKLLLATGDICTSHLNALPGLCQLPANIGYSGVDSAKQVLALSTKAVDSVSVISKAALSVVADINECGSHGILQTQQRSLDSFGRRLESRNVTLTNSEHPVQCRQCNVKKKKSPLTPLLAKSPLVNIENYLGENANSMDFNAQPGPKKLATILHGDDVPVKMRPDKEDDVVEVEAVDAKKSDDDDPPTQKGDEVAEEAAKQLAELSLDAKEATKPQMAQVAQQVTVPDQPVPDQNDLNLNTFTHEVATSFVSQSKEVKEIACTVATRNADIAAQIAAQNADIGKNAQKTIDGIAAQQAALFKEILKTSSSSSSS